MIFKNKQKSIKKLILKKYNNSKTLKMPYRKIKMLAGNTGIEDSTKYGEFISSYFNWISLDEQKKRAKELENMTNIYKNK